MMKRRKALCVVTTLSALFMSCVEIARAQTVPDIPTAITPLEVAEDPAGVNILTGKITLDAPGLSAPAAPRLTYQRLADVAPYISGRLSAGNGGYAAHLGGKASVSFKCLDYDCATTGRDGAVFLGSQILSRVFMPSGVTYNFYTKAIDTGTAPRATLYYASSVEYKDGETITYTYDSATYAGDTLGRQYKRPRKVTSSAGYYLSFTYQSNDINQGLLWERVATAELYRDGTTPTLIGQLTYSGNTITDMLGRVFACEGCANDLGQPDRASGQIILPGESAPDTVVTANNAPPLATWPLVSSVTRSGSSWGYTFSNPTWNTKAGAYKFSGATVVGPGAETTSYEMIQRGEQERNLIASVTDPLGRKTSYEYDSKHRVVKVVAPELDSVVIDYDAWGNVTQKTSVAKPGSGLASLVEQAGYNTAGCYASSTDMACFRPQWIRDAKAQQTDFVFNARGQLAEKTDPADQNGVRLKTILEYETAAPYRITAERKCAASLCGTNQEIRTEFSYWGSTFLPSSVRRVDVANAVVLETTYTYDAAGRTLSIDSPLPGSDDATHYRYDAVGRKIWEIGPRNADGTRPAKKIVYRASDDQVASEDEGWVTDVTDAGLAAFTNSIQTASLYGSNRKVSRKTTVSAGVTYTANDFLYDSAGRMTCSISYMGVVAGSPASSCAPTQTTSLHGADRVTRNVYDAAGQLLQIRKGVGTSLEQAYATYSYTPNGKQAKVIDANGNLAELVYDGFDHQVKWIFPAKTLPAAFNPATPATALATAGASNAADYEQYGYDANGNRTSLRKRDGLTLTFEYDALGRVTRKVIPNKSALDSTHERPVYYEYDLRGLMTKARFGSLTGEGVTTWYDAFGRITSSTFAMDGASRTQQYCYDANGNRTRMSYPDSSTGACSAGWSNYVSYTYDGLDRPSTVGAGAPTWTRTFTYNQRGELISDTASGGGGTTTFGRDAIGRLSSLGRDVAGTSSDIITTFGYNPASQTVSETRNNDAYAYTARVNFSRAYAANGLNQYATVGAATYGYDVTGNLTCDNAFVYKYDVENRLVEKRAKVGTSCTNYTGELQATLRYDPMGRLYESVGTITGTTRYFYDGDALVAEYDGAGTLLRRYVHGPNGTADDPLAWYEGSAMNSTTLRYLHADRQGSITLAGDSAGNAVRMFRYDEYGMPQSDATLVPANAARFMYTGQAWIPDVGMYYYKARMYSPPLGRFMQTDPIGYEDQVNLYAYVGNDPVNGTDPTGTETWGQWWGRQKRGFSDAQRKYHEKYGDGVHDTPQQREASMQQMQDIVLSVGPGGISKAGRAAVNTVLASRLLRTAAVEAGHLLRQGGGRTIASGAATKESAGYFRRAEDFAKRYGGDASNYEKVASPTIATTSKGAKIELHAVRNNQTGKLYDMKYKVQGGCSVKTGSRIPSC